MKSNSFTYSLYAVIEHSGTLRSGHYIAYIKQSFADDDLSSECYSKPIDELFKTLFNRIPNEQYSNKKKPSEKTDQSVPPSAWYHISDNAIHKVPESKVLESDAYVLFYRRV